MPQEVPSLVIKYNFLGDSSAIIAKTSTSSQVILEINLMYRLKIEYLHELWSRYPARNQKRDMITTAKVYLFSLSEVLGSHSADCEQL